MTRLSHRCMFAVLLALTALLPLACGGVSPSPAPSPSPLSGVQGRAMIGGGRYPGIAESVPGVTVAVHEGDLHGETVATTTADSSAAFKVDLRPGTYTLMMISDGAMPQTITVEPGKYVTVTLWIAAR